MKLDFATNSKIFSAAIEAMRVDRIPFTEANIKKAYEAAAKGKKLNAEDAEAGKKPDASKDVSDEEAGADAYDAMNHKELKALADERELPKNGNSDAIRERLRESDKDSK